jgi:acetyl esterase/lipase
MIYERENMACNWTFQDMHYGLDAKQTLNLKLPLYTENVRRCHALVYIHGGAYLTGDKAQYPAFLADFADNAIFATIDYRLLSWENDIHMAHILSDINFALFKIKDTARKNGISVKDYILVGHSAGGHIALLYGYKYYGMNSVLPVALCVALAGPSDYTDDVGWSSMAALGEDVETRLATISWIGTRLLGKQVALTTARWTRQKEYVALKNDIESLSPIWYTLKKPVPATVLVHARNDIWVPYSNSVRLNTILNNSAAAHILLTPVLASNDHMLGGVTSDERLEPITYAGQQWVDEVKNWIEAYVR